MRIGGFYKHKDTEVVYRMKGFSVELFATEDKQLEIKVDQTLQLYPEHAYTYRQTVHRTVPLEGFAVKTPELIEKLEKVILDFLSENHLEIFDEQAVSDECVPLHPPQSELQTPEQNSGSPVVPPTE